MAGILPKPWLLLSHLCGWEANCSDLHILSLCRFILPPLTVTNCVSDGTLYCKDACLVPLTLSDFLLECDLCCVYLVSMVLDVPLLDNMSIKVEVVQGDVMQGGSSS